MWPSYGLSSHCLFSRNVLQMLLEVLGAEILLSFPCTFLDCLKKVKGWLWLERKKKSIWLCKCSGMKLDKPVKHYDPGPIKFPSIFRCPTFKRKEWLECALCSSKIIYLMVLYHERKTCSKRKWHIFCKTSHINLKRFQKRLSKG